MNENDLKQHNNINKQRAVERKRLRFTPRCPGFKFGVLENFLGLSTKFLFVCVRADNARSILVDRGSIVQI